MQSLQDISAHKQNSCEMCARIHLTPLLCARERILKARFAHWLDHFGIRFHQMHASGHMNKEQIGSLISKIEPNKICPVHTENARLLKKIARIVARNPYVCKRYYDDW